MKNPGKGPSRWCYLLGASLLVVAFVTCSVLLVVLIHSSVPDTRFVVPGTHEAYLESSGDYTVYYEYCSVVDGETYSTGPYPSSMSLQIESTSSLQSIEVSSDSGSTSYRTPKHAGRAVLRFSIDQPGTYASAGEYGNSSTGPEIVLAVAKANAQGWALRGLGIIVGSVIIFWIGVFVLIWTFLKRRNASKPASQQVS